jgi:hypothetical protein
MTTTTAPSDGQLEQAKAPVASAPEWPDLTFHAEPEKSGYLIEPSLWLRDAVE